ncbi:MAG: nucleoside triphosphate pyrophosphohydrolase [Desulfuromusa sp.]|nr:nucleoside triphosphate pyrophosphohydrolase [Desulfuromusa sp.]
MIAKKTSRELLKLIDIMATLRSSDGCPWDQKQTPETLKPYILEEAYELIEAIDSGDTTEICDELGDLLLQVIFIAQIFSEQKKFGIAEVANSISCKLIRRHPHVFADANIEGHAKRWEEIKQKERSARGKGNKLAERIPNSLPALKKAAKVIRKIEKDETPATLILKLKNDYSKLSRLTEKPVSVMTQLETTLGEIFFSTVHLANSLQIDAEDLLRKKTMQVIKEIDN